MCVLATPVNDLQNAKRGKGVSVHKNDENTI